MIDVINSVIDHVTDDVWKHESQGRACGREWES